MSEGFLFLLLFNTFTFSLHSSTAIFFCLSPFHVSLCSCENLGGPALEGSQIFFFRVDCLLVLLRHHFQKVGEGGCSEKPSLPSLILLVIIMPAQWLHLSEEEGKSPPCKVAVQPEHLLLQNEIQISMLGFVQTSSRTLL